MAYSMDLRERVVAAPNGGPFVAEFARRFGAARGCLAADTTGPNGLRTRTRTPAAGATFRRAVQRDSSVTADGLAAMLSVLVSRGTVYVRLRRLC